MRRSGPIIPSSTYSAPAILAFLTVGCMGSSLFRYRKAGRDSLWRDRATNDFDLGCRWFSANVRVCEAHSNHPENHQNQWQDSEKQKHGYFAEHSGEHMLVE